jgi:hypothetical protein
MIGVRDTEEYRELQTAFHRLWTKYTHEPGYDKPEWQRLNKALEAMIEKAKGWPA